MIKSQPVRWLKHFSALEQSWFLITPLTLFCLCWSIRSLEPEHYDRRDFRQPWHPWWLCLLLKHRRFGTKDTRLFYYSKIFADLRFVWFGSDRRSCEVCLRQYLLSIQRYIRFDRPPRQLLGRMAPASSSRDRASALRDGGPIEKLREVLCMPSRPSYSLPSSSQLWVISKVGSAYFAYKFHAYIFYIYLHILCI